MSLAELVIFGSSGHARVIAEALHLQNPKALQAWVSANESESQVEGRPVLKNLDELAKTPWRRGVIGVGDNHRRARIALEILERWPDFEFVSIVHPRAIVSPRASLGPGSVVMAGAVINTGAKVLEHCIINTGAVLEHDCVMAATSSIGPGALLGGNVQVGEGVAIGLGAHLVQGLHVGQHSVIGAGSVVLNSIPEFVTAYGNPCRVIRPRQLGEAYLKPPRPSSP